VSTSSTTAPSKKPIIKDSHGEIIISKLDEYVEPTREVKETRGGLSIYINEFLPITVIRTTE